MLIVLHDPFVSAGKQQEGQGSACTHTPSSACLQTSCLHASCCWWNKFCPSDNKALTVYGNLGVLPNSQVWLCPLATSHPTLWWDPAFVSTTAVFALWFPWEMNSGQTEGLHFCAPPRRRPSTLRAKEFVRLQLLAHNNRIAWLEYCGRIEEWGSLWETWI